jgi:hypothetical protein
MMVTEAQFDITRVYAGVRLLSQAWYGEWAEVWGWLTRGDLEKKKIERKVGLEDAQRRHVALGVAADWRATGLLLDEGGGWGKSRA